VFLLLQASLGIAIDARADVVSVREPYLPDWLERVTVKDLAIGGGRATLQFRRQKDGVEVELTEVEGDFHLTRIGRE
jgi:hypothetical protein